MNLFAAPFTPHAGTPEMARRLCMILGGLSAVVARRFLREPALVALAVPLWHWLSRSAQRFVWAVLQPGKVRPARVKQKIAARASAPASIRLPSRRAWLLRALGWEAAGYRSQLQHLLAEPDRQAFVADMPAIGRILRPLCRMLGVPEPVVAPVPVVDVPSNASEAAPPWPPAVAVARPLAEKDVLYNATRS